jgi:hypothetical protein
MPKGKHLLWMVVLTLAVVAVASRVEPIRKVVFNA